MIYTTKSNTSQIKFYLSKQGIKISGEFQTEQELNTLISSPPSINLLSKTRDKKTYVGAILSVDPHYILCPAYTDIYISTNELHKPCIDISDLYKEEINKISFIFEPDALLFFWDRFGEDPMKAEKELLFIKELFVQRKERMSLKLLLAMYESTYVSNYPFHIGTDKGTDCLLNCSSSERYLLFYSAKPILYSYLIKRCPVLWAFIYRNMKGEKDNSLLIDSLVRSTFSIDKRDPNKWVIERI